MSSSMPPFGAETENSHAAPLAPVADAREGGQWVLASRAIRFGRCPHDLPAGAKVVKV
ncbi:MAG: hypothetical protein LBQ20_08590 [Rhodanobacter sp.]|jgi:hypothetical protein|nr:hypothetical protein [Rhodanobacter sp.]